jgi:hypothetical protein
MKTINYLIVVFFLSLMVLSCSKDDPLGTNYEIPKPPVQINEIDLVGLEGMKILSFDINPKEPYRILASTSDPYRRVYSTQNYGKDWDVVIDNINSHFVTWDPQKPDIAYASRLGRMGVGPHLLKSTDYGNSWFRSDSGIRVFDTHITRISINSFNSDILYSLATVQPFSTHIGYHLFKSIDGSKYWQRIDIPGTPFDNMFGNAYVYDFVINNTNPNIMFVGLSGISSYNPYNFGKTIDGGITWLGKAISSISYVYKLSNFNNLLLAISGNVLAISRNAGESFEVINQEQINRSKINDVLTFAEDLMFTSIELRTNKDSSFVFYSTDKGYTWKQLGNDFDRKTVLDYDSKNNFLYVVKDGFKKGLYRYKIK